MRMRATARMPLRAFGFYVVSRKFSGGTHHEVFWRSVLRYGCTVTRPVSPDARRARWRLTMQGAMGQSHRERRGARHPSACAPGLNQKNGHALAHHDIAVQVRARS